MEPVDPRVIKFWVYETEPGHKDALLFISLEKSEEQPETVTSKNPKSLP